MQIKIQKKDGSVVIVKEGDASNPVVAGELKSFKASKSLVVKGEIVKKEK